MSPLIGYPLPSSYLHMIVNVLSKLYLYINPFIAICNNIYIHIISGVTIIKEDINLREVGEERIAEEQRGRDENSIYI